MSCFPTLVLRVNVWTLPLESRVPSTHKGLGSSQGQLSRISKEDFAYSHSSLLDMRNSSDLCLRRSSVGVSGIVEGFQRRIKPNQNQRKNE
mmetsp:Transcript_9109/g.16979  ORF Transcript_9109/g.16979 Transcript_9109/m.16979 type:complete len:91 (-) Transcript_9109:832-1104(-)